MQPLNKAYCALFTGVSAILLNGCATPVNCQIPISIFQGSETRGRIEDKSNLTVSGGYRADVLAEIIPNVTTTPIITGRDKMQVGGDLFGDMEVKLHDRFEAGAAVVTSGLPLRLHGKWMFYGEPSTTAKKGDFSVAAAGELSLNAGHHWSAQDTEIFTNRVFKADVHENKASSLLGGLAGRRITDTDLFYSGFFLVNATDQGTVDPTIDGQKQNQIKIDFKAAGYSVPIGFEHFFTGTGSFRVEGTYCSLHGSEGARYHAWGLNLGLAF